ncbi:MAG TPA: polysaccharide deacetylase [Thermoplasmataceae archaeon]|nr:polysaccharide deacetylase [Thermoplasmatales archaeon AK]HLH85327.1 polysaccharide deacetylase [Thermoplasmataceae archaeon]
MRNFLWPDGHKACMCLTWDMDGEAAMYFRNPEEARNQLSELVQRSYGPNVGIYKILDLLEKYGIPGTFYIPGYTANLHPEAVKEILERKHPIGLHGYMHETMDRLSEEGERAMFELSLKSLKRLSGKQPILFRSPSFELNRRTPELLLDNGVQSDSSLMGDDYPYLMRVGNRRLLEIPVQWTLDDFEFWGHTKSNRQKPIADIESTYRMWKGELQSLYRLGGCFVLTMHPFVSGRSVYLDAVERLIKLGLETPGLWIASMKEVTDYCLKNTDEPFMLTRDLPSCEPINFDL